MPDGVVAARGDAGDDTIIGTGVGIDIDGGEDMLRLKLDPKECIKGEDAFGHVSTTRQDGNTLIQVQGSDVVRIKGATGLAVGFEIGDSS